MRSAVLKASMKNESIVEKIKKRQTEQMVIAFCGAVGSGIDEVKEKFVEVLREYSYRVIECKISKHIHDYSNPKPLEKSPKDILVKQDDGNRLRNEYGNDILALSTSAQIDRSQFA